MLLLILLLSLPGRVVSVSQEDAPIRVVVVRQEAFHNKGHHPENNRRVIFKLVNQTDHPVVVFGMVDGEELFPAGYMLEYCEEDGRWVYPSGDSAPPPWKNGSDVGKDKYVLRPKGAITFEAEMSQAEVGSRFKRSVYISVKEDEDPKEVRSDESILK